MRKTLLVFVFVLAAIVSAVAHTIGVGYAFYQQGSASGLEAQGKAECSAAILIGSDKLAKYQGNEIRTVRVSLERTRIYVDSVVVWVRQSLDGENIATGKLTRFKDDGYANMKSGWNEVALDKGVAIAADSRLYVGYTYYQRTTLCDTRLVDVPTTDCSFVKLGADADWTETTGGTLAIEAGVDGTMMPANDISLLAAKGIILSDGTRQIEARLCNRGQDVVSALDFAYDNAQYTAHSLVAADIQPDKMDTITFNLSGADVLTPGSELKVKIQQVNGSPNQNVTDNILSCLFNYLRIVLVEEFTTEQCPNCPQAAAYLHDILAEDKSLARQMAVVCHHSGYQTDRFTTTADLAYEWFYNDDGGTSAPSMMYNRTPQKKTDNGMTPTLFPDSRETVESKVKAIANEESSLIITATAQLSADNKQVQVEVAGKRLRPFGSTNKRITVFLTEDNVLADAQAGSGSDTYYHQHLMRCVNTTWGDPLTWQGDEFTYTCSFDIADDWKLQDLKVVAAVGDYDSTNPANCQIENTAVATLTSSTGINNSSISAASAPTIVGYYSADGRRLSCPQHGLYIVRFSNGKVKKMIGCKP